MSYSIFISLPVPPFTRSAVSLPSRHIWLPSLSIASPVFPCFQNKRMGRSTELFAASSPGDESADMTEMFWITGLDDELLADVVTKTRKYHSASFAKAFVEAAIRKLGTEVAVKDPLWADLLAESKLVPKLGLESNEAEQNYMLERKMTRKDFEKRMIELDDYGQKCTAVVADWCVKYGLRLLEKQLPDGEVDFWISGLDDPFLADVVTAKRRYDSAVFANLSVNAAKWKLGAEVAEKDPLWADLLAESKTVENLWREFNRSKFNYALKTSEKGMTCEEFLEKLDSTIRALRGRGQIYSRVVANWLIKYGTRLFEAVEDRLVDNRAVSPVEISTAGSIDMDYHALVSRYASLSLKKCFLAKYGHLTVEELAMAFGYPQIDVSNATKTEEL